MKSIGIEKLKLVNFRSYKSAEVEFSNLSAIIFGKNGVGKTNLLEAISLLYSGKGLRKANFSEMTKIPENNSWKIEALCKHNNNLFEEEYSHTVHTACALKYCRVFVSVCLYVCV